MNTPAWMLPAYGKHDAQNIANQRRNGHIAATDIYWAMDLVSYVPANNPRHARRVDP